MVVIGIETSTAVCSVGLADENGGVAERSIIESHIHSEKLLTLTRDICKEYKIDMKQVDGFAVSIGPGSFTGLRIGLSTVKGLCYSLEKPLVAISGFEAIAHLVLHSSRNFNRVIVCVDAKQGEYYLGAFETTGGLLNDIFPPQIGNLQKIQSYISEKTLIVTDQIDEVKKINQHSGVIENILPYCRGDSVAMLALGKLKKGEKSRVDDLEPMYLKDFIVRSHEKKDMDSSGYRS